MTSNISSRLGKKCIKSRVRWALGLLAGAASCSLCAGAAHAGIITYAGEVQHAGASASVTYGTDGYDLYATTPVGTVAGHSVTSDPFNGFGTRLTQLPSYLSSITAAGANENDEGWGYASITNPATSTLVQAGEVANFVHDGSTAEKGLLDFTITGVVPSSFYIGFITNTSAGAGDYPDSIRISQIVGGSGDSGLSATNKVADAGVDVYFFNIQGAQPGDVYHISGVENIVNPGNNSVGFMTAGLLFSSSFGGTPTPEPASLGLLGAGAALLLTRRRRA